MHGPAGAEGMIRKMSILLKILVMSILTKYRNMLII